MGEMIISPKCKKKKITIRLIIEKNTMCHLVGGVCGKLAKCIWKYAPCFLFQN